MRTSASGAAALGAKVALIERDLLGGDCLNGGCVPSKAIIRTPHLYAEMRDVERMAREIRADIRVDFAAVMERVRGIRARISRADSVHRLIASGVVCSGRRRSMGCARCSRPAEALNESPASWWPGCPTTAGCAPPSDRRSKLQSQSLSQTSTGRTSTPCRTASCTNCAGA